MPKYNKAHQLTLALNLVELLQAKEDTTVQSLAEQLGRSRRTVERMFAQLRDVGLPVYSGPKGYGMPPQAGGMPCFLTDQEQLALSLLERFGLPGLGEAAQVALQGLSRRLKRNLSTQSQQRLDRLDRAVAAEGGAEEIAPEVWDQLSQALARQLAVRFQYIKLTDVEASTRSVEPWGLLRLGAAWYLQGFDLDRRAARTFRLNRIHKLQILSVAIEPPVNFDPSKALFHSWDIGDCPPTEVELELPPKLARWISENPAHPRQRLVDNILTVSVKNLDYFVDWLLGQRGVRLLSPESLHQLVREVLEKRSRDLLDTSLPVGSD